MYTFLWIIWTVQIKSGLWVNPRVPEMVAMPELQKLARTYGKFWCTWQVDRGIYETLFMFPTFFPLAIYCLWRINLKQNKSEDILSVYSIFSVFSRYVPQKVADSG